MKKELDYVLEYLSLSKQIPFDSALDFLQNNSMLQACYDDKKILRIHAAKDGIKIQNSNNKALSQLDTFLHRLIEDDIQNAKKMLFDTLVQSNFKKKKEELDKVETSIYKCLNAYVTSLCRILEVFYCYDYDKKDPRVFIEYGNQMHKAIVSHVFNKDEIDTIKDQLKQLLGVYLAMYSRYMYQ